MAVFPKLLLTTALIANILLTCTEAQSENDFRRSIYRSNPRLFKILSARFAHMLDPESDMVKRYPNGLAYAFGLGKRVMAEEDKGAYNFGIGKRGSVMPFNQEQLNEIEARAMQLQNSPDEYKRQYSFGIGKRSADGSNRFAFGLGKRGEENSRFAFGLGKRLVKGDDDELGDVYESPLYDFQEAEDLEVKRGKMPYAFGLGKRDRGSYSFGLGKRGKGAYSFGLGKRGKGSYSFGLGKRGYSFGLGKRDEGNDEDLDLENIEPENYKRRDNNYGFGLGKRGPSAYGFGLGKRGPSAYGFGLGKRSAYQSDNAELQNLEDQVYQKKSRNQYQFGLGKRSVTSADDENSENYDKRSKLYAFGLGKRGYEFGLGKRNSEDSEEHPEVSLLTEKEPNSS